jgi:replication factor C large subunit
MLSEKYRPKSLDSMVGNKEARDKFLAWLKKWKTKSKAALLVGPPGTGKTTTVHIVAEEMKLNLVELNASDSRTKEKLGKKIGAAISSTSLLGERTLVFLDEVDGLAGRSDYGAIDFIKEAVRTSVNPIVMAANNPDADEVRKLASVTTKIEFLPPTTGEVLVLLRKIDGQEKLGIADAAMHSIAESSHGDLRYALNALQGGVAGGKDQELRAAEAINAFLGAPSRAEALRALRAYPGQPRDKLRDLFSSVIAAKLPEGDRARALAALSRADQLMGRIMRTQEWRQLSYLDPLLSTEFRDALGGAELRYSAEGVPWLLQLRIWNDARKVKEISRLASRRLGISGKAGLVEDFPYIMQLSAEKGFREELVSSLGLDEPHEKFIVKESAVRKTPQRRTRQP